MAENKLEEQWYGQVRKGLLEYIVFEVLKDGDNYGYAILQKIREYPSMTKVTESAVYPVLVRSVKEGLIESKKVSSNSGGPPRNYFTLQAKGRIKLAYMKQYVHDLQLDLKNINSDYES